jgi:hypothetical protein
MGKQNRLRFSLWSGIGILEDKYLRAGIVDDITLLHTFTLDPSTRANFGAQPLKWAPDGSRYSASALEKVIRICHRRKIQILAGVGLEKETADAKAFNGWLQYVAGLRDAAAQKRTLSDAAKGLAALVAQPYGSGSPPAIFDGIGLDIEFYGDFTPKDASGDKALASLMTMFYQAVADAVKPAHQLCTAAIGAMVLDGGWSTKQWDKDQKQWIAGTPGVRAIRVQPYDMVHTPRRWSAPASGGTPGKDADRPATAVNLYDDMILRPMAFDAFPFTRARGPLSDTDPDQILDWHKQIVTYALTQPEGPDSKNAPSVEKSQFQLGIKLKPGPGNRFDLAPTAPAAPAGAAGPQSPAMPSVRSPAPPAAPAGAAAPAKPPSTETRNDAVVSSPTWVRKTARMLRSHEVGLILFAFTDDVKIDGSGQRKSDADLTAETTKFWGAAATYNFVLNATSLPPESFDNDGKDPSYDPKAPTQGTVLPGQAGQPLQVPLDDDALRRLG